VPECGDHLRIRRPLLPQIGRHGIGRDGMGQHEAEQRNADKHRREQQHTPQDISLETHGYGAGTGGRKRGR